MTHSLYYVFSVKNNFCEYCVKMHVVATCADYEKEVTVATVGTETIEAVKLAMDKNGATITEISVDAVLPVSGIWHVSWFATLFINGQKICTPHSHEARVDLTSEEQRRRRAAIHSTDELAKQRAGDVQFMLRKLRGPRPDHLEIERRCDLLHEVVARGRSTLNRLLDLLRADGASESTVTGLVPLREALELAGPAKETLEAQFELSSKKDSLKSFKVSSVCDGVVVMVSVRNSLYSILPQHHVAGLLESGEAATWLRTVEDDDLVSLGGETNRLYQLFVEGKVAHHLELDAATLEAAVGRTDLFTPKQCEALEARKVEIEAHVEQEAERALAKAKEQRAKEAKEAAELAQMRKKQAEEETEKQLLEARFEAERQAQLAAIRESEEMARGMVVGHPAHSLVEIQGLKTIAGATLNGTLGTVMHKKGDRYVVECQNDGKLRSFLPASLHNLGVTAPGYSNPANTSNWNCDVCTFLHEGDRIHATACDMCNTPRGNKSPGTYSATAMETAPVPPLPAVVPMQVVAAKPKAASRPIPEHKATKPDTSSQKCFHGAACRYIRNGHNECKFYHSPEEIEEAVAKHKGGHTLYIPDVAVGWVIGKHGAHMKVVQQKSRAKVSIDQKRMYPNKTRIVRMSGSQQSIDTAIRIIKDLVEQYDDGNGTTYIVTETVPTSPVAKKSPKANGVAAPVARKPTTTTSPPQPIQQTAPPPQPIQQPALRPQHIQQPKTTKPAVISPPKSAYLTPPPQIQEPVRNPVENKTKTAVAMDRAVTPSPPPSDKLQAFLKEQKVCLKGSPKAFGEWLSTEDIVSLEDLAAAVSDDDYLHQVLQQGNGKVGVKGFKRVAFKKAALAAVNQSTNGHYTNGSAGLLNDDEAPTELMCPISHVLMLNDPVIASDGHTYERIAIDTWIRKQQMEIIAAKQQVSGGKDSEQARSIIERGVLSPMTHSKMSRLDLTPNHNVRNLARGFASRSTMN